ncbi:rhamnogalacturonan lyase family protein [Roseimarinus sediminis]|uniref:rhamnogalacturonan lyase family protein n=1 Tax=Roseimarinus sediminis TaxID=1610899 RepID=UPI003D238375
MNRLYFTKQIVTGIFITIIISLTGYAQRPMEYLNRGLVAMELNEGVFLSWRMLGTEPVDIGFNIYRNNNKINTSPVVTSTNYIDQEGTSNDYYHVIPIINGEEMEASMAARVWEQQAGGNSPDFPFKRIPLPQPPVVDNRVYVPGDAAVADLDGDGQYEIIFEWESGPDQSFLEAIDLEGNSLWRIEGGPNVSTNKMSFLAYDLDGDGKAELTAKTGPGTKDGTGAYLSQGPAATDNDALVIQRSSGNLLTDPAYLSVFDGESGKEITTVPYWPELGPFSQQKAVWGDSYGHRASSIKAAVLHTSEHGPIVVYGRGIYTRIALQAYRLVNNELINVWTFDSEWAGNERYRGQGNHSVSVGDVDNDGSDELMYGACAFDHDGKGLYSTGMGHGDADHLADHDPDHPGLEFFQPHENNVYGISMRDAATGEILWEKRHEGDIGRAWAADVDPAYRGSEVVAIGFPNHDSKGNEISTKLNPYYQPVYWDGDVQRELRDGTILYDGVYGRLMTGYHYGASTIHGSKNDVNLVADILGDWREEIIWKNGNNTEFLLFSTIIPTERKNYTLMHDPVYRMNIAVQAIGYNQPAHVGYYFADGAPEPDITLLKTESVFQPLAFPWKEMNIGPAIKNGSAGIANDSSLFITAAGAGITQARDEFHMVYQTIQGDGQIVALINSIDQINQLSKAGIMIRENTANDAKNILLAFSSRGSLNFQYRAEKGGTTSLINKPGIELPCWLKMNREGNTFTASYSNDGTNWIQLSASELVFNPAACYGIAVSSSDPAATCTASFDNIKLSGTTVGTVLREWWTNIPGNKIDDLTANSNFPSSPDGSQTIDQFTLPVEGWADHYGSRISGYLYPIQTGSYQFYISGNEQAELWLSADTSKTKLSRLAYLPGETAREEWDKYPEQTSVTIELTAGAAYYIEALHKEGEGDDHMAVAWSGPGLRQQIIDGDYLAAQLPAIKNTTGTGAKAGAAFHNELHIYPNPVKDILHFTLANALPGSVNGEIFSVAGVRVFTADLNENRTISTRALQPGIYLLKITDSKNVYFKRFVKE